MKKLVSFIGIMILAVGASFVAIGEIVILATLTGTIIYFIWPVVVPIIVPKMIEGGYLPAALSWWVAVCFSWLWRILFIKTKKE